MPGNYLTPSSIPHTHTYTHTHAHRDRQTDRQTDRPTDGRTDRQNTQHHTQQLKYSHILNDAPDAKPWNLNPKPKPKIVGTGAL